MNKPKKRWFILLFIFCLLFVGIVIGIRFVAERKIKQYINQSIYTTPLPTEAY